MRTVGERCPRTYSLNEGFFTTVDTPLKAYILGFIAADGCICRGRLQIALKREDRGHLERLAAAMGSNTPVGDYLATCGKKKVPYSVLMLHSKQLVADLARLGIHPRKSHTVRPWDGPDELMPAYWLGVMDGDGSLYEAKRDKNWRLGLVGNQMMTDGFRDFIQSRLGIASNDAEQRRQSFIITWRKLPQVQAIVRLLYADAPMCLDRKKIKAQTILSRKARCVYRDHSK